MTNSELRIEPEAARAVQAGDPRVARSAVLSKTSGLDTGSVVDLVGGAFVGRGIYDAEGPVAVRVLTRNRKEALDGAYWRRGLERASNLRRTLVDLSGTDAYRVVNAEGDFLPGLVVESYSSYVVLRLESEALRPHLPAIVDAVKGALSPRGIYEKRGGPDGGRGHHVAGSTAPDALQVREGQLRYMVRMAEGADTGLSLALREARRTLVRYCRGRSLLNLFAGAGTFSLHAATQGAGRVVAVDPNPRNAGWSRENFSANGLPPEGHEFVTGDAQDILARVAASTRRFDIVSLECPRFDAPPPPPAKPAAKSASKGSKKPAAKAKKPSGKSRKMSTRPDAAPAELFLRGMRDVVRGTALVLPPQGLLATALPPRELCTAEEVLRAVKEGAVSSGVTLQVLDVLGPPADFPSSASCRDGRAPTWMLFALRS
jgi:23S rRNA (cytosine1962-C5)-methyltransferase